MRAGAPDGTNRAPLLTSACGYAAPQYASNASRVSLDKTLASMVSTKPPPKRTPALSDGVTVRRWLDVLASGVVSGLVVVIFAPRVTSLAQGWARGTPSGTEPGLLVLGVLGLAVLGRYGLRALGNPRYVLVYPPAWMAVLVGYLSACAYWTARPEAWRAVMRAEFADEGAVTLLTVGAFVGLFVVTVVMSSARTSPGSHREGPSHGTAEPNQALHENVERLLAWLEDDAPVASPALDVFGRLPIAKRIARRLANPAGGPLPAIAVVGPLGSGKTSLRRLVEGVLSEATTSDRVRLVSFSAWPYETVAALVSGILETIVDTLSGEIGAPVLGSLPHRYVESVVGAVDKWGTIVRALRPVKSPLFILRQVDQIADALGVRIVLWVEDLERFGAGVGAGSEPESVRERLAPVRALLHQLEELRSVSVVVASTSLTSGFDLEKLARYIEVLEPIGGATARRVLAAFRKEMLERAEAAGIINVASTKGMANCDLSDDVLDAVEGALVSLGKPAESRWGPALSALCSTPRALKQGLRECLELSTQYAGEIDLDHLLAASLLRHGQPAAFAAVLPFVDRLRNTRTSKLMGLKAEDDPSREAEEALDRAIPEKRVLGAARTIVGELFNGPVEEHPQGFHRWGHVDYWRRYLSLPEIPEPQRDQTTLRVIRDFVNGSSEALADLCLQPETGAHVEWFVARLDGPTAIRLLDAVLERAPRMPPAMDLHEAAGGVHVWRIALDRARRTHWPSEELLAVLGRHVVSNVPSNLVFVDAIMCAYVANEDTMRELLRDEERVALRGTLASALVEAFVSNPAALASALDSTPDYLLSRLLWGLERVRRPDDSLRFGGWAHFAPVVLEAARVRPEVMLPQLAYLVTSHADTFVSGDLRRVYSYLPDLARRLFGDADVLVLFRDAPADVSSHAQPDSPLRAVIDLARSSAP